MGFRTLFFVTIRHWLDYASRCFWEKSDNSTLQLLQWHQHANSKAHTHHLQHLEAAPCSGTTSQLQSGHATLTAAPCSVQQRPSHSTLAARVGYSTYPPCSTLKHHPLQQHQQASPTAPSSSTFHRHPLTSACPLQSRVYSTHHSDSSTFKHHPQAATAAAPWAPPASLQTVHTTLTASNTLHQHLAAALQGHHDARSKARTPLWQQHAQRQQHASCRALHVWYNYQQLKHFRGKCG